METGAADKCLWCGEVGEVHLVTAVTDVKACRKEVGISLHKMTRIRPEVGANCSFPIEFQITDVTVRTKPQSWRNGKPRKEAQQDRVTVYVCGTSVDGHSVSLEVGDFNPYVFIRVPDNWQEKDATSFMNTLNKAHCRGGEKMTGELLRRFHAVGYRPGPDGQPYRYNFMKVGFPTLRLREAVCRHFKASRDGTRKPGNDAMWCGLLKAMGKPHSNADLQSLGKEIFTLHHDQVPHAQAFMNTVGVSASAWLKVTDGVLVAAPRSPHKLSNMQIEIQKAKVSSIHPVDRSDMAPMVILSFDIESYSESREFPKWWKPTDKIINVGMNFSTCAGAAKPTASEKVPALGEDGILRTVLCLGSTGQREDVQIDTFQSESELLSAFQQRVADPALDPDILLGYNIFDFDFMYLAQRAALITLMRKLKQTTWNELEAKWKSTKKKVSAFQHYTECYRSCSDSDSKSKKSILARLHNLFGTRGSRLPSLPSEALLLSKYESAEELREAVEYFGTQPSTSFNLCSRLATDVCSLTTHTLESSAMGSNELRRFDMAGRVCLDLWLHLKNGNSKLSSYSLSNVSKHFLGMDKADMPYNQLFDYYASGDAEKRAEIAEYCSRDCDLPILLVNKLGTVSDLVEMSRVCRTPLPALTTRGQQVKVYSQLAFEVECAGAVLNTVSIAPPTTYVGATVIEPKPGYHDLPVATLDFASLYPSIMQANNIGPGSYVLPGDVDAVKKLADEGKINVSVISTASESAQSAIAQLHAKQREKQSQESSQDDSPSPPTPTDDDSDNSKPDDTTHYFVATSTYKGLVPKLLSKLLKARSEVKKQMKKEKDKFKYGMLNSKQLAIKISCNSVYGFFGVKAGYLPCWPVAACTTATGRRYIDQTKEAVETKYTLENGYPGDAEVVYGDTDSVMVKFTGVPRSMEGMKQAWKLAEEAADFVSDVTFADEKEIVLEAEKVYWPYMIWDTKKRYIGRCFMHPEHPPKIDAKGVELVRRDNAKLVRDIYGRMVDAIMPLEGAARSVEETRKVVEKCLKEELDLIVDNKLPLSDYVITKSLKTGYKSDHLPHVQLVKKIMKRIQTGTLVREPPKSGQRIPYVIVQGKGQVYERAEDPSWITMKKEAAQNSKEKMNIPQLDRIYYLEQQLKNAITKLTMYFHTADSVFRDAEGAVLRQQNGNHSITSFFSAGPKIKASTSSKPASEMPQKIKRALSETARRSVADSISARLKRASAVDVPAKKRTRHTPSAGKRKVAARPKTASASKRKMSSSSPRKSRVIERKKKKKSILDSSSEEEDESDHDEDYDLDYDATIDDGDFADSVETSSSSPAAESATTGESNATSYAKLSQENADAAAEEVSEGEESSEEEEEAEQEDFVSKLHAESLEKVAFEWLFRAKSEIMFPSPSMFDQIKFFLAVPLDQAIEAVSNVKKTKQAVRDEIAFWESLVAARKQGDIAIPTAEEMQAAEVEPAEPRTSSAGGETSNVELAPGTRVSVFWPRDEEWYSGVLGEFDPATKRYYLTYDDGENAWLDLQIEEIKVLEESESQQKPAPTSKQQDDDVVLATATDDSDFVTTNPAANNATQGESSCEGLSAAPTTPPKCTDTKVSLADAHMAVHEHHVNVNADESTGAIANVAEDEGTAHEDAVATPETGQLTPPRAAVTTVISPQLTKESAQSVTPNVQKNGYHDNTEVTPKSVTIDMIQQEKIRSRAVGDAIENIKKSSDFSSLTKKYRNDGSAAAALAATIAAYAEEDDEAVTELDDGFDDIADEFDLDDIDVGDDEI